VAVRDLRRLGWRDGLLAVAFCALAGWGCNATEKEVAPSPKELPEAGEDAVFGLSWSATEEDLRDAGVISGESEPFRGKLGRMYSEVKLPRRFEDAEWCGVFFNDAGELIRVACVGKSFRSDPSGKQVRKRYEELKDVISRKIPIAGVYEDKKLLQAREDWWGSLKSGKAHWATGFRGEVMEAVLEIRAESSIAGSYNLIVDHVRRMRQLDRVSDGDDRSVF
jgi:hypothetical protein